MLLARFRVIFMCILSGLFLFGIVCLFLLDYPGSGRLYGEIQTVAPFVKTHQLQQKGQSKTKLHTNAKTTETSSSISKCLQYCLNATVTFGPGGRFGNAFMAYASGWAIAHIYNLTLLLPENTFHFMNKTFEDIMDTTVNEYLLRRKTPNGMSCASCISEKSIKFLNVHREVTPGLVKSVLQRGGPLVLGKYITLPDEIVRVMDVLRGRLRFRKEFAEHADEQLERVRALTLRNGDVPEQSLVFVGVHVRRTDYLAFVKWRLQSKRIADEAYYCRAVASMQTTLALKWSKEKQLHEQMNAGNITDRPFPTVVIVITSDDMEWVHDVLVPALAVAVPSVWVHAIGQGTEGTVPYDLALLSSCNHTILAYGTYGLTAALLAGGYSILYYFEQDFVVSKQFADIIPSWIILT